MIRRREFITLLGGSAAAVWPLAGHAQQPIPVVGFIAGGSPDASARFVDAFRKGLNETGFVEGQNVRVEYHWLEGKYDQLPALTADLVSRRQRHEARRDCATSWRARTRILSLIKNTDESSCRSCRLRSSNRAACC